MNKKIGETVFGSIFLLFGIVIFAAQDFSPTGNIISQSTSASDASFILTFALMIIGGVLFYKSFKN